MRQAFDTPSLDRLIAELAERQHGVVEHTQLLGLGVSESGIRRRIVAGRLHRLHMGVYAVGHRSLSAAGRRLAAIFACGRGSLLSHHTAADVWGIRPSSSARIHVTVPTTAGHKRPGIALHRTRRPPEPAERDGLPVTTVARTFTDLARTSRTSELRKAIERAERLRVLDAQQLEAELRVRPSRALRRALDDAYFGELRSDLESDFLALCKEHGIPLPETNVRIGPYEVDFLWRAELVVVEVDGWEFHRTRSAVEDDHRRNVELALLGLTVLRFTHDAISRRSADSARQLAELLAQRKPRLRNQ